MDLLSGRQNPAHPEYSTEESRKETFNAWSFPNKSLVPAMTESGLFYSKVGDMTTCFFCGGSLKNWYVWDDPWVEHAKWFPRCFFVLSVKGYDFVSSCNFTDDDAFVEAYKANNGDIEEKYVKLALAFIRQHGPGKAEKSALLCVVIKHIIAMKDATGTEGIPEDIRVEDLEKLFLGSYKVEDIRHVVNVFVERYGFIPCATLFEEEYEQMKVFVEKKHQVLKDENEDLMRKNGSLTREVNALMEENTSLKEGRICKICMVNESTYVFIPCGHLSACSDCVVKLTNQCPCCRNDGIGAFKIFS